MRTGQPNTRTSCGAQGATLTRFSAGPSRSVPGYAFPFTEQTEHIQKRARPQPTLTADRAFMLTPSGMLTCTAPNAVRRTCRKRTPLGGCEWQNLQKVNDKRTIG